MKVTPPHTRLAPWRRIAGITNPDTTLPPGVDPPPTDPDDEPIDRAADEQGGVATKLASFASGDRFAGATPLGDASVALWVDEDDGTWATITPASTLRAWDIGGPSTVEEIRVKWANAAQSDRIVIDATDDLAGSWTNILDETGLQSEVGYPASDLTWPIAPVNFRYWRLTVFTGNSDIGTIEGIGPAESGWILAPLVIDGSDTTYEAIEPGTELIRMDLGAAFDITRTRIRIATTTAGARTFTIKGANVADFSDEVTLTTIDFTATGGLTAQDVTGEWSPPEAYRYYQLDIDDSDTYRVHTWELFEDPPPEAVDDHGELSGLGDDDHPQYLRVRDGGGDQVSTIGATGAAETIDLGNGNVHQLTLDDDCTLTFTGAAAGRARSFRLYLWQDGTGGHVVTWPGSVEWAGGTPTISTTADSLLVFMFETLDGGTVWHGYPVGGGASGDFLTADEGGGDIVNTVAASGAAETLDLALGNFHDVTLTADCTFTFDTPAAGRARWFTLQLTQDGTGGWEVTWPGSVLWIGGVTPTLDETAGTAELLTFYTLDGGTSWVGSHAGGGGSSLTPATTVEAETTWGITPAVGTDLEYARQDHTHGTPAEPAGGGHGPVLLASDHSMPFTFDQILQASDGSDFLYASE